VGVAVAFYFGYQRFNEINARNDVLNGLLADQRASIEANHNTIETLNQSVVAEREARETLRREYETELERVRADLQRQIDIIRRRRGERTTELTNNPSELVDSYSSTFGFGRRTP